MNGVSFVIWTRRWRKFLWPLFRRFAVTPAMRFWGECTVPQQNWITTPKEMKMRLWDGKIAQTVREWSKDQTGTMNIEDLIRRLEALPLARDLRTARWKARDLGKASGRQGQRIFELRNEVAALREILQVRPGDYKSLLQNNRDLLQRLRVADQRIEELEAALAQSVSVSA